MKVVIALLMFLPMLTHAETRGIVSRVTDGDTIVVSSRDGVDTRVRLRGIDAPERNQPYGQDAKIALSTMILGRPVIVIEHGTDRYGRVIGTVMLDVGATMVLGGRAWVYRQYSDDPALIRYEEAARGVGIGLWALPETDRIPPWKWRHQRRSGNQRDSPGSTRE